MRFFFTYLRFYSNYLKVAAILLVFTLICVVLYTQLSTGVHSFTLLGDVDDIQLQEQADAITVYDSNPQPRPIARSVEAIDRSAVNELVAVQEYDEPLLKALNCARTQTGHSELLLDSTLSEKASRLWQAMVTNPNTSLRDMVGNQYEFVAVLPLTLSETGATQDTLNTPCAFGGTDMTLFDLSNVSSVGIAVFPDTHLQDGLEESSAVLIAK